MFLKKNVFAKYIFIEDIEIANVNVIIPEGVYAKLYDCNNDGIGEVLVLNNLPNFTYLGTLISDFSNEDNIARQEKKPTRPIWRNSAYSSSINKVVILNEILPKTTEYWFCDMKNLKSIENIKNLNTVNVTSMQSMFYNCNSLESIDLSNFNTNKVTSMFNLFGFCKSLKYLNVSSFNTSNVDDISGLFSSCSNLTKIDGLDSFNTSKVLFFTGMFRKCTNLTSLDLSSFSAESIIDATYMFNNCNNLKTIYAGNNFNLSNVTETSGAFNNCYLLEGGNGTKYSPSITDGAYARIDIEGQEGYFTKK